MATPRLLKKHHHGADVEAMQKDLIAAGYGKYLGEQQADGDFGPNTLRAVKAFQHDHGISETGNFGRLTRAAMENALGQEEAPKTKRATPAPAIAHEEGEWKLTVQKTGTATSKRGYTMATGNLILTSPQGEEHIYPMRSGGFGEYKDKSMLPGLDSPIAGSSEFNASYSLEWKSFTVNDKTLPKTMKDSKGKGSWLRLGSIDTDRGGVPGKSKEGYFGIHTDGASDGTEGCIGLEPKVAKKFFAKIMTIPRSERPEHLYVLPTPEMQNALAAFRAMETASNSANMTSVLFPQQTTRSPLTR